MIWDIMILELIWIYYEVYPNCPISTTGGGVAERQPATNTALFQVTLVNQYIIVYPDILDKISRI
jgi:hypothetical protein